MLYHNIRDLFIDQVPNPMKNLLFSLMYSGALLLSSNVQAVPTSENTVDIRAAFEFSSLDPTRSGFVFTRMQVLETLLNVDDKGALTPGLASFWQLEDGGKRWLLTLRDKVRFHDGSELTAEHVASQLKLALQKPSALQGLPITSVEAVGSDKVAVVLAEPYRPLGAALAHYSTSILANGAYGENGEVKALIGTGPFAVEEVVVPHKLVVQRFNDYWGKKAQIEYATYLTGHRAEARVLQARSGQADIVFGLDPASVPMLQRLPTLEILRSDLPRTLTLKLNAGHALLSETAIRQALSLAINRQGIATAILRAPDAATDQLLPVYMGDWHLAGQTSDYDLEKAAQLLVGLGWKKGSDGWLEREGQRFELELITYADRPELTTVATAIQDQWKQLGVKLNVNVTNSSAIPAGHSDGSLETALIARNYGIISDPLGVLLKDFGSDQGGDWGSMNWANTEVPKALAEMVSVSDPQLYRQQAQVIAEAIYVERPLIPVASYVQQTAISKRLSGFRFDPYERSYFLNELSWK